jgi:CheY-like chemotaxis protein
MIIEDSDEDFETLSRIIDRVSSFSIVIQRCLDGDDALDFLNKEGDYSAMSSAMSDGLNPELILLDLNLPGTDGREVLAVIKNSPKFKTIPVVVISTSANPQDIEMSYQLGVNSYMLKPMNITELSHSVQILLEYWFHVIVLPTKGYLKR